MAKRNYEIHDKEMLARIRALEEWRYLVQGSKHKLEIWTDHKNLEYFLTAQKLNRRQAQWSGLLADYDFCLKHKLGKSMLKPDALSRRLDHKKGVENDNKDVTLITADHILALLIGSAIMAATEGDTIVELLKERGPTLINEKVQRMDTRRRTYL